MAYAFIVAESAGAVDTFTTAQIDTTGADLIVIGTGFNSGVAEPTITDSKSNTWTPLTSTTEVGGVRARFFYCQNPTVGSGHDFTATGLTINGTLTAVAFSGSKASPFDQENGSAANSGTTLSPGSVTPSENNELIITTVGWQGVAAIPTIDLDFATAEGTAHAGFFGGAVAYLIQGAAAAVAPTWTFAGAFQGATRIATFKSAAAPVVGFAMRNVRRRLVF